MDYRTLNIPNEGHYFYPLNEQTKKNVEEKWLEYAGGEGEEMVVQVPQGRDIKVQRGYKHQACEVTFDFLCNTPSPPPTTWL